MRPKIVFDVDTDGDVFALAELSPDMCALVAALLEHINNGAGKPLCGATDFEPDLLVEAALSSDCNECRSAAMIGPMADHRQREVIAWEPQPRADAEAIITSARDNREALPVPEEAEGASEADCDADPVLR